MAQTSTPVIKTANSIQDECAMESLSGDDEQFYASIQPRLKKLVKQPKSETIEAILKYSKSL